MNFWLGRQHVVQLQPAMPCDQSHFRAWRRLESHGKLYVTWQGQLPGPGPNDQLHKVQATRDSPVTGAAAGLATGGIEEQHLIQYFMHNVNPLCSCSVWMPQLLPLCCNVLNTTQRP